MTDGCKVLDLGCGSGILSIAALRPGAEHAVAVDIDPKAVDVAYENAAMNDIGKDRYHVLAGDVLTDEGLVNELAEKKYQVVLANIVADVIIPLSAKVDRFSGGGRDLPVLRHHRRPCPRGGGEALERNGLTIVDRWEKRAGLPWRPGSSNKDQADAAASASLRPGKAFASWAKSRIMGKITWERDESYADPLLSAAPGDDLRQSLERYVREQHIRAAVVLSAVGCEPGGDPGCLPA